MPPAENSSSANGAVASASYEVHYFPIRGRGEATRLALAAGGADFVNVNPEWPASKANYTFGQLPALVLKKDGTTTTTIPQSMAMLRHVGRAFDLYGKGEVEHAQVDVVLEALGDVTRTFQKAAMFSGDNKEVEVKKFVTEYLPQQIAIIDTLLATNTTPDHVVGNTLTIADICLYDLFHFPIISAHPSDAIKKVFASVEANPGVAAYLKSDKYYPKWTAS